MVIFQHLLAGQLRGYSLGKFCFCLICLWAGFSTAAMAQQSAQTQLLILHNDFVSAQKYEKLKALAAQQGVQLQHMNVEQKMEQLESAIQQAEMVILDVPRPPDRKQVEDAALARLEQQKRPYMIVGGGAPKFHKVPMLYGFKLLDLYASGGMNNFKQLFISLQRWITTGEKKALKAEKMPDIAIYHSKAEQIFDSVKAYQAWYDSYQTQHTQAQTRVVYVMHPSNLTNLTTARLDELIELTEQQHVMPVVLLWSESKAKTTLSEYFKDMPITAMVNLTHIQNGQQLVAELEKINAPMIQALSFHGSMEDWHSATSGVPPHLASVFLSLPETWGFSDPTVLSIHEHGQESWMPGQLGSLLRRTQAQARLKYLSNAEKQLALMFWNYPHGQQNLSASNLNIPRSLENIQTALQHAGYDTHTVSEQQIIHDARQLLAGLNQPEKLKDLATQDLLAYFPVQDYLTWLAQLPADRQQELATTSTLARLQEHWAVVERKGQWYFAIPRVQYGKVMLLPQPPRSSSGKDYHRQDSVPDPLYLATYLYLQQHANALIHLGTHGTQEWLPGKDKGLSVDDYSYLTAGDLPIFYPYVQDNLAEAIQAKRRGRAVTISHQTAALAPSGLYDELRDLHDLIHQYVQLNDGMVKQDTQNRLIQQTLKSGIAQDLSLSESQMQADFPAFYAQLHDHLHALAGQAVPMGLHQFGQAAEDEQRLIIVLQQLGADFIQDLKYDPKEIFNRDVAAIQQSLPFRFLKQHVLANPDQDTEIEQMKLNAKLKKWITTAQENYQRLSAEMELSSLLTALNGGFIVPGSGGDPIRQPETISGRNLYAFEAGKIPTPSAYSMGSETFGQMIQQYQQKHPDKYPAKIAVSLWSSETIRHLGVSEGQVLAALGLKPVWNDAGKLVQLEIIPREALQRPRVDVVVQATSVYRDQFDGFIRLLAQAMSKLAQLDEADNPIYTHSQQLEKALIAQHISPEQAQSLSRLRIFSNAPGEYGSGFSQQILTDDQWDQEQQLASTFLNRLQYAYGEQTWGEQLPVNMFAENLKGVEMAIMSRSSNVQGVLSTDHPFEYLGGLSLAVRQVQGASPELLITDLRQNKAQVTLLNSYLSDEMRTRYLNPTWIKAMQQEGYAGTLEVLNATNNLYGWNVADPAVVRKDQWDDLYDTYVQDKRQLGVNEWFEKHHPSAQLQMLNRMAEAIHQDYWQADQETKAEIAERIHTLRKRLDHVDSSRRVDAFMQAQLHQMPLNSTEAETQTWNTDQHVASVSASQVPAHVAASTAMRHQGVGLNTPVSVEQETATQQLMKKTDFQMDVAKIQSLPETVSNTVKVKGQTLEAVQKPKEPQQDVMHYGLLFLFTILGFGAAHQIYQQRQR
ncbi:MULTISPECIES: cobaltochelatase subunit CobN [unclassified Acinetobacter]|uniref:cobaltochelatase subunit CobN n=1 Tax=unclassified Acinetobacter TaxID=196816 RepID=UPI0015D1EB65|nr:MULTISPECIES: cobaltochelatase subunit CobN [unclassified Acinetobacter]